MTQINMKKELLRRLLKRVLLGYTEEEVPKEVYHEIDKQKWMKKVVRPTYMKAWTLTIVSLKFAFLAVLIDLIISGVLTTELVFNIALKTALFFFVGFTIFLWAKKLI